ncbi:Uncharacterised protein [Klebsiella variicola]|uniref:Uncharacterized protein n=1 Tax=Klebsiella variicola TaxID=244366 RepID=A0A7H4M7N1_KLEVA|nr:Uncharacterised protein [Klebsiella variicola]
MKLNYVAGLGLPTLHFPPSVLTWELTETVWGIAETDFLTVVQQKLGDYIKRER